MSIYRNYQSSVKFKFYFCCVLTPEERPKSDNKRTTQQKKPEGKSEREVTAAVPLKSIRKQPLTPPEPLNIPYRLLRGHRRKPHRHQRPRGQGRRVSVSTTARFDSTGAKAEEYRSDQCLPSPKVTEPLLCIKINVMFTVWKAFYGGNCTIKGCKKKRGGKSWFHHFFHSWCDKPVSGALTWSTLLRSDWGRWWRWPPYSTLTLCYVRLFWGHFWPL